MVIGTYENKTKSIAIATYQNIVPFSAQAFGDEFDQPLDWWPCTTYNVFYLEKHRIKVYPCWKHEDSGEDTFWTCWSKPKHL